MSTKVFARHELKYLLSPAEYREVLSRIKPYVRTDEFGAYTIQSLYYDTETNLLIRRSIEKPDYKEKIRLRSYGLANADSKVFVEIKKKSEGKVYKRRIKMRHEDAVDFISGKITPSGCQITSEITYFRDFYSTLMPSMLLIYDRTAYFGAAEPDLRITFDDNVLFRDYDLSLDKGLYGQRLITGKILMEIKVSNAIPLWLTDILSSNNIYKTPYSKYGHAYAAVLSRYFKEELSVG